VLQLLKLLREKAALSQFSFFATCVTRKYCSPDLFVEGAFAPDWFYIPSPRSKPNSEAQLSSLHPESTGILSFMDVEKVSR
jgi:hypothetical protein